MEGFTAKINEICERLNDENRKEIFEELTDSISAYLAELFKVTPEEIALIVLTNNKRFLRFIAPKKLYHGGATFPLTKRESVSTKVMMTKKCEIKNDMLKIKHLSIYEQVKMDENKPKPIQKMITVPLLQGETAIGVIQISRKGYTLEESGEDFSENDGKQILEIIPVFLHNLMEITTQTIKNSYFAKKLFLKTCLKIT